ncbi:hypothetical protein [Brachyspira hampsonii]|uniref:Uncharacterized protein n=1 Tax=Brachyspira hampsonii 30446 TaxID=1289135 RepID=A0A2U4EZR4_9SPIR|nr:hypothetical protein [Brachyspira hampsonii]EKV57222.1 hypothetical protein A966_06205 [Brachyspira hampsonii 30446]MBW5388584.1 hypothetical protein [Brachyspira hampsonii]MBW5393661.1 hypothetical protein [Brachyspira hampsonii]OEJ12944.1 hypothetical protein A9495_01120 [Brachyspira hampsonii]
MEYKIRIRKQYLTGINRMIIFAIMNGINNPRELLNNVFNIFYKYTVIKCLSKLMNVHLICIRETPNGKGFYLNKNFDGEYCSIKLENNINLGGTEIEDIKNIFKNNSSDKKILKALDFKSINL